MTRQQRGLLAAQETAVNDVVVAEACGVRQLDGGAGAA